MRDRRRVDRRRQRNRPATRHLATEDVALLTTGSRHPEQVARQEDGPDAYWESFWDTDQVFYGHVLGFKGLERRVVVLAVNETTINERSRERLYVGLSRARDDLVVCAPRCPVAIRSHGDMVHGRAHPRRTPRRPAEPGTARR